MNGEPPTQRLKFLARKIGSGKTPLGGAQAYVPTGVMFLRSQNIHFDGLHLDDVVFIDEDTDAEMASTRVQPEDVLLNITGASLGRCTLVPVTSQQANVSQHVCIIRPNTRNVLPSYLNRVLQSTFVQSQIFSGENGSSREGLTFEQVANLVIPLPGLDRQRAIADYLALETARLDALVSAKELVLGLLTEKRRALITRAVTRGLDPRAPLRASGIPWLGEIPAHWDLKRLKHVGRSIIGLTFDPADTVTDGSGVLVLRASNVRDQRIVLEDNLFVLMDIPEPLRTRVGDILICSRSGSRALIGKNALIDESSSGLTFGAFMTVFRSPHNEFLFYVFNSPLFDYQAGAFSTSTINQLTVETLNGMEIPLPPAAEQKAIVANLRQDTGRLDRLVEANERTIALLKERRAAVIAAAVTGQLEVA